MSWTSRDRGRKHNPVEDIEGVTLPEDNGTPRNQRERRGAPKSESIDWSDQPDAGDGVIGG